MTENKQPEHELPADFVYRVLSARSVKVVELALQEAFRRDHSYLGTEHILVGLAEESQDVTVTCSPKVDPSVMRVSMARLSRAGGSDEEETAQSGADHRQVA